MAYNVYVMDNDNKIIAEFLLDKKSLILKGLEYIDKNVFKPNYLMALTALKWKCVIVPDSEWTPSKWFPTETSFSGRETRILSSYMSKNPTIVGYGDKCGWAYHELVHAAIFSGNFPSVFLEIESPFEYPLNTDEIYCYGYQMKHLIETKKNGNLMRFAIEKIPFIKSKLCLLRNALFK